jgi:hypothetical protein
MLLKKMNRIINNNPATQVRFNIITPLAGKAGRSAPAVVRMEPYPKNTTTASHRHTETPCKIASVERRARSDAPYQSDQSIPIRANPYNSYPQPAPPPRLRGKIKYSPPCFAYDSLKANNLA